MFVSINSLNGVGELLKIALKYELEKKSSIVLSKIEVSSVGVYFLALGLTEGIKMLLIKVKTIINIF